MTNTPTDDQAGFAPFRLIHPGQTYYLTMEQGVLARSTPRMTPLDEGIILGGHSRQ